MNSLTKHQEYILNKVKSTQVDNGCFTFSKNTIAYQPPNPNRENVTLYKELLSLESYGLIKLDCDLTYRDRFTAQITNLGLRYLSGKPFAFNLKIYANNFKFMNNLKCIGKDTAKYIASVNQVMDDLSILDCSLNNIIESLNKNENMRAHDEVVDIELITEQLMDKYSALRLKLSQYQKETESGFGDFGMFNVWDFVFLHIPHFLVRTRSMVPRKEYANLEDALLDLEDDMKGLQLKISCLIARLDNNFDGYWAKFLTLLKSLDSFILGLGRLLTGDFIGSGMNFESARDFLYEA